MIMPYKIVVGVLLLLFGYISAFTQSELTSEGVIYNTGKVVINGNATIKQDSIGAVVEYSRKNPLDTQRVAQITYYDLRFSGAAKKNIQNSTRPVIAANSFFSTTETQFELAPFTWVEIRNLLEHEGDVNPARQDGTFKLNGTSQQDISGKGRIPIVELVNASGASVTGGGGLRIAERLDLQIGVLNNTQQDNVFIANNAWIWRSDKASLTTEVATEQRMNLRYYGTQRTLAGPEISSSQTVLQQLLQENSGGLDIARNSYVNERLLLRGNIYTENNSAKLSLIYSGTSQPEYPDFWPEVIGTLVRTRLSDTQPNVMNGAFTTLAFESVSTKGNVSQLELRSLPKTVPTPTSDIALKVNRFMQLTVKDATGAPVTDSTYTLVFGYAWRTDSVPNLETGQVVETIPELIGQEDSLVLLRYDGGSYSRYGLSVTPTLRSNDANRIWRYSTASMVRAGGDFAIGLSTGPVWILNARLFLEGAMREYADGITPVMGNDLAVAGLIPTTPPNIYPYNADPNRANVIAPTVPDSIVDWVTMELRASVTQGGPAALTQNLFVTRTGELVDPVTLRPKVITNIQPGLYHVVMRHRNHLAIATEDAVRVDRGNIGYVVDFTAGAGVFGGAAAQKLLGVANGRRLFGLATGEVNNNDGVDRADYTLLWDNRDSEGYLIFDTNLDGIVTTYDLNLSWNNRGRSSVVLR